MLTRKNLKQLLPQLASGRLPPQGQTTTTTMTTMYLRGGPSTASNKQAASKRITKKKAHSYAREALSHYGRFTLKKNGEPFVPLATKLACLSISLTFQDILLGGGRLQVLDEVVSLLQPLVFQVINNLNVQFKGGVEPTTISKRFKHEMGRWSDTNEGSISKGAKGSGGRSNSEGPEEGGWGWPSSPG